MPSALGTYRPSLGTYLSPLEIEALFLSGSPALRQAWLDLSKPSLHMLQLYLQVLSQLGCFYSLRWAGKGRRGLYVQAWGLQSMRASVKHPMDICTGADPDSLLSTLPSSSLLPRVAPLVFEPPLGSSLHCYQ